MYCAELVSSAQVLICSFACAWFLIEFRGLARPSAVESFEGSQDSRRQEDCQPSLWLPFAAVSTETCGGPSGGFVFPIGLVLFLADPSLSFCMCWPLGTPRIRRVVSRFHWKTPGWPATVVAPDCHKSAGLFCVAPPPPPLSQSTA